MPKINVYLPDDLATAVRESGVPVSPVCQKALADAVRAVSTTRKAIAALRDATYNPRHMPQSVRALGARMTPRLREALEHAQQASASASASASAPSIDSRHLLIGLIDQGDNLALRLLHASDVDTDQIRDAAETISATEDRSALPEPDATESPDTDVAILAGLSMPARGALASTTEAAIELGHNYLGCEHLLLGLLDNKDTAAAQVLGHAGVEQASLHRAVKAATVGVAVGQGRSAASDTGRLDDVLRRLDAIETLLASIGS